MDIHLCLLRISEKRAKTVKPFDKGFQWTMAPTSIRHKDLQV